ARGPLEPQPLDRHAERFAGERPVDAHEMELRQVRVARQLGYAGQRLVARDAARQPLDDAVDGFEVPVATRWPHVRLLSRLRPAPLRRPAAYPSGAAGTFPVLLEMARRA